MAAEIDPAIILLVEDDDCTRDLVRLELSKRLREYPIKVETARSGNEVIRLLKGGRRFSFIISDYHMSDGNGADLLRYVCEQCLPIPFVLFTSEYEPKIFCAHEQFLGVVEKMQVEKLVEYTKTIVAQ